MGKTVAFFSIKKAHRVEKFLLKLENDICIQKRLIKTTPRSNHLAKLVCLFSRTFNEKGKTIKEKRRALTSIPKGGSMKYTPKKARAATM